MINHIINMIVSLLYIQIPVQVCAVIIIILNIVFLLTGDSGGPILQWMNGYWDQVKYFFISHRTIYPTKKISEKKYIPRVLFR